MPYPKTVFNLAFDANFEERPAYAGSSLDRDDDSRQVVLGFLTLLFLLRTLPDGLRIQCGIVPSSGDSHS